MWTQGRGGEPGKTDIEVQFRPYPECLEGYFGGLAGIIQDTSHEVQVRLGKGQHHLKMPRSYLRLYPSKQVLEEWLELTNQAETWTSMGTPPLLLLKHCHNALWIFFHCHNAVCSSCSRSFLCSRDVVWPQSPVAVACTWLLVWPYPTTEVDTGVSKWTRFHLACHGSRVGKTLGDEVRLLPRQRKHFGDPQLLWERELSHLAWCGGLYADTDTYARLLQERGGTAAMSEYLPLVSVGLSWKDSFR